MLDDPRFADSRANAISEFRLRAMKTRCRLRGSPPLRDCPCEWDCAVPSTMTKIIDEARRSSETHEELPDDSPFKGV